jgi:outer membrane autotransporter protein
MLAQQTNGDAGDDLAKSAPATGAFAAHGQYDFRQVANVDSGRLPVIRGQNASLVGGAWATSYQVGGNIKSTAIAEGPDYGANGVQLGVYRWLDYETLVGVFGGYSHQDVDILQARNFCDINSVQLGAFLRQGDAWNYWLLGGAAAYDDYYLRRTQTADTFDGAQASAYIERGWSVDVRGFALEPSVALQYTWLHQDDHMETGPGALTFSEANTNSLRSIVGARISREHCTNCGLFVFTPELRAQWMHEYLDDTTAVIIAAGGPPGTSTGISLGRDWVVLGCGFALGVGDAVRLFVNGDLQLNERTALYIASGGLQW